MKMNIGPLGITIIPLTTESKKNEKYDPYKQREASASADDAFARLYATVDADIDNAIAKAEKAYLENNRATAVELNAEVKRLSKEELEARFELVLVIIERIKAIPDGSTPAAANQIGGWRTSSSNKNIKFDSSEGCFDNDFFQESEESDQFRLEYEMRQKKQDEGLDRYHKDWMH
ncbi:hypothetical protein F3Y22_tig00003041pilonHSYRG01200 [Hibiscus syriacus]|uniref:Uncharacterized protein n=1 Tax=Hibiscus syriacus TaxID=106335 RepID=A0A6A3CN48_HIBSY|nr:hypothetical protein F3Y22_tig00003041pilonHSYRG01200 [Hibiscus syriacus]